MLSKANLKQKLEEKLAEMHCRKYCIVVSRGTVAIYLALKALGFDEGKVVLPSILCLSPANAIIYAGLEPIYCDVNLSDFNLDINDLERIFKKENKIRTVILPHIYGQPTDIDRVISLTQKYSVKLIEDAAQAMGGQYKNKPLGSFGEFSILSFGHTKILDAGGCGALLFDDKKYLKIIKNYIEGLPLQINNYRSLQEKYLKIYYALAPFARREQRFGRLYYPFPYVFKDLYLFQDIKATIIEKIYKRLKDLNKIVARRNENAEYYRTYLQHEKVVHPKYDWKGVYWRYSFVVKCNHQLEIAEEIRKSGINVSNWYPPIHLFYELIPPKLKNAEYLGSNIFNLWVEPEYTKKDINRITKVVLKILDKYKSKRSKVC